MIENTKDDSVGFIESLSNGVLSATFLHTTNILVDLEQRNGLSVDVDGERLSWSWNLYSNFLEVVGGGEVGG